MQSEIGIVLVLPMPAFFKPSENQGDSKVSPGALGAGLVLSRRFLQHSQHSGTTAVSPPVILAVDTIISLAPLPMKRPFCCTKVGFVCQSHGAISALCCLRLTLRVQVRVTLAENL